MRIQIYSSDLGELESDDQYFNIRNTEIKSINQPASSSFAEIFTRVTDTYGKWTILC